MFLPVPLVIHIVYPIKLGWPDVVTIPATQEAKVGKVYIQVQPG